MSEEFGGYPNVETYTASLYMDNDECLFNETREMRDSVIRETAPEPRFARHELASRLEEMWADWGSPDYWSELGEHHIPNGVASMLLDVGSQWRVDWLFIADDMLAE